MTKLTDYVAMTRYLLSQEAPKARDIAETGDYLASLTPDLTTAKPADFSELTALADTADLRGTSTRVAAYALEEGQGVTDPYLLDAGLPKSPSECREISDRWFALSDALRTVITHEVLA